MTPIYTTQVYQSAPVKRMSILERRPGDERAFFSHHWREIHGGMVSELPFLHAYVQNHVVEDFPCDGFSIPGDGLVEQLWRTTEQMQRGYNSPVVAGLIADEVNYLGHGSNYAILAQAPLGHAPDGNKLVLALRHGGAVDLADAVADLAADCCEELLRDDVIATIAKANFLPVPPRPVDMFLHLICASPKVAGAAGNALAQAIAKLDRPAQATCGLWRVTTHIVVAPPV